MKCFVLGAGVVGQVYAGRLAEAGHEVTILARGERLRRIRARGIVLQHEGTRSTVPLSGAVDEVPDEHYDVAVLAVRADQVEGALATLARVSAGTVVTLGNTDGLRDRIERALGPARVVFAFPGVGGRELADGVVEYLMVAQQHTTVGAPGDGRERPVAEMLRAAGFPVATTADMDAWLATHTVFVAGLGVIVLRHDGDPVAAAHDRPLVRAAVRGIGEAFRALPRRPVPGPLRAIFTVVPRPIAVRYWQRQLRGPVGRLAIAPHVRATAATEFPVLVARALEQVGAGGAPHFHALFHQLPGGTPPAGRPDDTTGRCRSGAPPPTAGP